LNWEDRGWLIHFLGDISHSLAAAGWIGALVVFCILLARPICAGDDQKALCASLAGFSGIGTLLVALIVVSGLINSFFLVGWEPAQIVATRYGQVLMVKLALHAFPYVLLLHARHFYSLPESNNCRGSGAELRSGDGDFRGCPH
jgi:putative copper resistance protein D